MVVADQFGDESILQNALSKKGHQLKLEQRLPSRRDSTVMAASILARAVLTQQMQQLSQQLNQDLPIGASDPAIITIGQEIVAKGGQNALADVAKLHFRTTQMILQK
jgi:ribonuclease HIII